MKTVMNYKNQLPVNTWNHLNVNQSTLELTLPRNLLPVTPLTQTPIPSRLCLKGEELEEFRMQSSALYSKNAIELIDFMNQNANATLSVHTKPEEIVSSPIDVNYYVEESNPYLFDETNILAEEDSEITILLDYQSANEVAGVHGSLTNLYAKKNSKIHLIQVQLLNDQSLHFNQIVGYVGEGASIDVTQIELGANKNFVGSEVILGCDSSSYENQTIYLGTGKQMIDMNYLAKHLGKHSKSKMIAKGSLSDESQKIFRATIDFKRGCSYATGEELEETLLLSPNIKNKSVPLILCEEDNVSGAHAANIGNLKESQMFYLMSRGLTEEESKQLLIRSRLEGIYASIPNEMLKEKIESYISRKLTPSIPGGSYENN